MSNIGEPSVNAVFFTIESENGTLYDAHFDINEIEGSHYGDVRYRPYNSTPDTPWVYLLPVGDVEFDKSKMQETIFTDLEINDVLNSLNKGIEAQFGIPNGNQPDVPEYGIERAIYAARNNLITENNNVIKYTKPEE